MTEFVKGQKVRINEARYRSIFGDFPKSVQGNWVVLGTEPRDRGSTSSHPQLLRMRGGQVFSGWYFEEGQPD